MLERLRCVFSEQATQFDGHAIEHTPSIGYTIFTAGAPSDKTLARGMREADHALYAAKAGGRNRILPFEMAAAI